MGSVAGCRSPALACRLPAARRHRAPGGYDVATVVTRSRRSPAGRSSSRTGISSTSRPDTACRTDVFRPEGRCFSHQVPQDRERGGEWKRLRGAQSAARRAVIATSGYGSRRADVAAAGTGELQGWLVTAGRPRPKVEASSYLAALHAGGPLGFSSRVRRGRRHGAGRRARRAVARRVADGRCGRR